MVESSSLVDVEVLRHRTIGDRAGEAKASGNLGNTLKVLGKYDEALACCQHHLDIARELGDKVLGSSLDCITGL